MFDKLGGFVIKYRIGIVLFWVLAAAGMFLFAPSLSKSGKLDQTHFLPSSSPSQKANDLVSRYFPGTSGGSSGTLVFYDANGLSDEDQAFAQQVQSWLLSDENKVRITGVTSIYNSPEISSRLVSPDKTTMLMNVSLSSGVEDSKSSTSVEDIRHYLEGAPSGLEVYVSGSAGIFSDLSGSLRSSIDVTTVITVALVVVLLLIIYRSPIASLVPLFTIGMAYLVSRGLLGLAAQAGISIWSQIDVFLIVLVFGAGTDYCLFMISRFREELRRNETFAQATRATVARISAVITASAFAVIIGLSGMAVARFGLLRTMGPVMAFSILVTLIAALTLTPAVTSLLGSRIFWPAHSRASRAATDGRTGFWAKIAKITTGHPAIVVPIVIIVMAIPIVALPQLNRSYDQLAELPQKSDSTRGFRVLQQHFNVGEMDPLTAIVVTPVGVNATSPAALSNMVKLGNDLRSTKGVAQVQSLVQPDGTSAVPPQFTVSGQLAGLASSLSGSTGARTSNVTAMMQALSNVESYLDELGTGFPWVQKEAAYTSIVQVTKDAQLQARMLASGTLSAGQASQASAILQQDILTIGKNATALTASFKTNGDPPFMPSSLAADPQISKIVQLFISKDSQAARMYVILASSPQSNEAITAVDNMRSQIDTDLKAPQMSGYAGAIAGSTASLSDMRSLLGADFSKIQLVVLFGVFVVFVLLLRSLVAPLYLMATVLLSYATTLGLVTWIFQDLQGLDGVSFIVPIIVFVLLVALGADYNIFLMSRVREESETQPTRQATQIAAGATGSVITACGLILAGTFAGLIFSPLRIMVQVGTAVGLGILIDTFVVRSLLVPAIATLLGRRNWWPSKFGSDAALVASHTKKVRPGKLSRP